jgi:hypothetical protein
MSANRRGGERDGTYPRTFLLGQEPQARQVIMDTARAGLTGAGRGAAPYDGAAPLEFLFEMGLCEAGAKRPDLVDDAGSSACATPTTWQETYGDDQLL